jgi:hypothetical protein
VESWAQETAHLSDEQMKHGLERTKDSGLQYAPALPKFLSLCRPETGSPRYLGTPMSPETRKMLAAPRVERDFSQLRKALQSGQHED